MSARVIRRLVAPWILASIGAACRLLPLRFAGQPLARPAAERNGAVPRSLDHRIVLEAGIRRPLSVAPMHAGVVVVDVEIFFPLRPHRSDGTQEDRELPIGDLGPVDEKIRQLDLMLRTLVLRPDTAAHQKHAGGHAQHVTSTFGLCRCENCRICENEVRNQYRNAARHRDRMDRPDPTQWRIAWQVKLHGQNRPVERSMVSGLNDLNKAKRLNGSNDWNCPLHGCVMKMLPWSGQRRGGSLLKAKAIGSAPPSPDPSQARAHECEKYPRCF